MYGMHRRKSQCFGRQRCAQKVWLVAWDGSAATEQFPSLKHELPVEVAMCHLRGKSRQWQSSQRGGRAFLYIIHWHTVAAGISAIHYLIPFALMIVTEEMPRHVAHYAVLCLAKQSWHLQNMQTDQQEFWGSTPVGSTSKVCQQQNE